MRRTKSSTEKSYSMKDFRHDRNYIIVKRINLFSSWYINVLNISLCMKYQGNISERFPSNSEANASELLEKLSEMFITEY